MSIKNNPACADYGTFLGETYNFSTYLNTLFSCIDLSMLAVNAFIVLYFFDRRKISTLILIFLMVFSLPLNSFLKSQIKDPRPPYSCNTGYGMPDTNTLNASLLILYILWKNLNNIKQNFKNSKIFFWIFYLSMYIVSGWMLDEYYWYQSFVAFIIGTILFVGVWKLFYWLLINYKEQQYILIYLQNDISYEETFDFAEKLNNVENNFFEGSVKTSTDRSEGSNSSRDNRINYRV